MYVNPLQRQAYNRYGSCFQRCSQNQQVPDSTPSYHNNPLNSLEVPHQHEVPMGMENTFMMGMNMNPERYFTCPDGSVIDLVTRKKVSCSKVERETTQKQSIRWIDRFAGKQTDCWSSVSEMLRNFDPVHPVQSAMGMSKDDIAYQEMLRKKDNELRNNMSEEQKNVLNNLEKFIGKNTVKEICRSI